MALFPIRHVGLKLLSIAVATLLWLVVTGDPVVERTLRVGVELQRTPAGLEAIGAVPEAVSVRVRGPAGQLSALAPGDLSVVLDLDGAVRPGRRTFIFSPEQVSAPYGIEVVNVSPGALPLVLEATTSKTVPVRALIEGTPLPGHSVTNVAVTPADVLIEGPGSAVARVAEVLTHPVSVERAASLVRESAALDVSGEGVRLPGAATALVTVTIAADTTERVIAGVPIGVRGKLPPRTAVAPPMASVTVHGAIEVVAGLTAKDLTLYVEVGVDPMNAPSLDVRAEPSARFDVKSIDPAVARIRRVR